MAETTLKDVLREVKGETIGTPASNKETSEGASKETGETKSGDTPEYVSGINISELPEQERAVAKKVLSEKAKLLESGYQKKFQEVAGYKKEKEDLVKMGLTQEEAVSVLREHIQKKQNPASVTADKKDAVKTLDKLINDAPYEQRQPLEQMRQIILEETSANELRKEIAELKQAVTYFRGKDMQLGEQTLKSDLTSLEQKFGKEFIEKYSDLVTDEWRKYPNSKAKDILKYVVPDDEYEQALLSKKTKTKEKLEASASGGSGVTSSSEAIDTKGKWRDTLKQIMKNKN